MHIGIAVGIFIVSYLIQLLLCFKTKSNHIKRILFYIGFTLACLALLLYMGVFGTMSMGMLGNGHIFLAVILLIAILVMFTALFLAEITHLIIKKRINRKSKENEMVASADDDYSFLVEKEAIWAAMFSDVLKQNEIPFITKNVLGAGITAKIGYAAEIVRFYVHKDYYKKAEELCNELFSAHPENE